VFISVSTVLFLTLQNIQSEMFLCEGNFHKTEVNRFVIVHVS